MSVVDSFLLLIQGDASSAIKALTETQYVVNNTTKASEGLDRQNNRLGRSFLSLAGRIAESLTIYHAFEEARQFFVESVTEAMELKDFSDALGMNINDVSAWKDAVKVAAGNSDHFQDSLKSLQKNLAQIDVTGKSRLKPFLDELGIAAESGGKLRNIFDILPDIAGSFEKLGKQKSFGIGAKMGLDNDTILLLQKGREETLKLVEAARKHGAITERQGELAEQLETRMAQLGITIRGALLNSFEYIMPFIANFSDLVSRATDYLDENEEAVNLWKYAFVGLVAFAEPLLALGAALFVVADDWLAFENGQKSAIGYILDTYPTATKILKAFVEVLKTVRDGLEFLPKLATVAIMGGGIDETTGEIVDQRGQRQNQSMFDMQQAQKTINWANTVPLNAQTPSSVFANSGGSAITGNVTMGDITIQTAATDSEGIARGLRENITNHLRQAIANEDDGVSH